MADAVELWERPEAKEIYMIVGWRQWADAGSISSSLPHYLIEQSDARQIGRIRPDGFYLFQIPGTHDLVRPAVSFEAGLPISLDTPQNELFYAGDQERGIVFFSGTEPHMDVERYVDALLEVAKTLDVQRIIGLGGVYGELPYDKERTVSATYSLPELKEEVAELAVTLSDYEGGASIGSYLCRRAGEQEMAYVGFYAFVPTYDFSSIAEVGNMIRLENDFMAWLGVMRRINYMLKLDFDLSDLEDKSEHLIEVVDARLEELEHSSPELNLHAYMERLAEQFTEVPFDPLDEVWEEELRRLFKDDAEA